MKQLLHDLSSCALSIYGGFCKLGEHQACDDLGYRLDGDYFGPLHTFCVQIYLGGWGVL